MKTRIKQITSLVVGLLLFAGQSFATSIDANDFKNFISQTFEENLGNLDHGNNIAPFLRAFSDDLVWVDVLVSTNGLVTEKTLTKIDLKKAVLLSGNTPSLYVNWKITNYGIFKVRENTIIGTFNIDVSIYGGDTIVAKGKNIVQVIATPINNTYVITYINILQTADAIYKGKCFVNLTSTDNNSYIINTFIPNGAEYENVTNEVNFSGDEKNQLVDLNGGEQTYYYSPVQKSLSINKMGGPKLASAASREIAIMEIIKIQQKNKCLQLVRSTKKATK